MNVLRRCLPLLGLGIVALATLAAPAAGHEGEGRIEVVSAEPAGDLAIRFRVRSVYVADGHGAPEATVTTTVVDPNNPRTPVALTKTVEAGVYEGTVTFPAGGDWTVRFSSLRPVATLEIAQTVAAPVTTTVRSTRSTAPPRDEPPIDLVPIEEESGSSRAALLGGLILLGVAATAFVLLTRRRRTPRP